MYTPHSTQLNQKQSLSKGGPLHYMGNRNLTWPNRDGRMAVDDSALRLSFSVISANQKSSKFRRCYEPFSGCASWSLAAMELDLADEYIINDSDEALINTLRLIKNNPDQIKSVYKSLVEKFSHAQDKKAFFLRVIHDYNEAKTVDEKSLMLPFIINHSWAGMIFHDMNGNIIYRDMNVKGKNIRQGYLETASLSLEDFSSEVDRVSHLLNTNKVTFKSGDFSEALSDMQAGDFVSMNPPYPETRRVRSENSGLYAELYDEQILHKKITQAIKNMESTGVDYYMTYGCYESEMTDFVIKAEGGRLRHFFRWVGGEECVFGVGLDQVYFSPQYVVPKSVQSKFIPAELVLDDKALPPAEALENFKKMVRIFSFEPTQAKMHVIFLANIFRIRVNLNRLKTEGTNFYLFASDTVINRMNEKTLSAFSFVAPTTFEQSELENLIGAFISKNELEPSSIVIVTNDESAIIPAAKLREKFGIAGATIKIAELFIDKIKMKQKMADNGVRIPKYVFFNPAEYLQNKERYVENIFKSLNSEHVFAKPIDSFGSNDVSKLNGRAELVSWCEAHIAANNFELDEFLVGELFHVDTLIANGKIIDAQPHRYAYPLAEVFNGKPFAGRLVSPVEADYKNLIQFNEAVLKALGSLPDGVTHLEVFKTQKGELVFLEIACRPSAGFTPELSQLHCGVNYEEAHYLVQMGLPIEGLIPLEQRNMYAAYLFYPKTAGEVTSLCKQPDLQTVTEFKYSVKPGDNIDTAQHLMDSVATVFMKSENFALLRSEFEYACVLKPVTVYPRDRVTHIAPVEQVSSQSQNSESASKSSLSQSK